MTEWNYKSIQDKSNGYENCGLENFLIEDYKQMNDKGKQQFIEDVFKIYRQKNIYPIWYFSENGVIKEIQKCIDKDIVFNEDGTLPKALQGQDLCRFFMPNLTTVEGGKDKRTMYKKFYDDHLLKRSIKLVCDMSTKGIVTPSAIRAKSELTGGQVATNFPPMRAKLIYEKYCLKNGIIYDYACGFGGRMLGALTSKNNYKYIGVEPCVETYENLNNLGKYIEKATNRQNIFKVFCMGSEEFKLKPNTIDFAFSSPPYFNLEKYSDENTQCYNKFSELNDWFNGYVQPTITNIYHMLKPNRYYAVNIADFRVGKNDVAFVDKWIELSIGAGFEFVEEIPMTLQTRRGVGHNDNATRKLEGIYVFKKLDK